MVFGGINFEDGIVVLDNTFYHFNNKNLVNNDAESIEINVNLLKHSMIALKKIGCDTFFMTHSHPCKSNMLEFMFGDLSDEDEVNSNYLRSICSKYNLEYYDGISTGKRLYFWSTLDKEKAPILMDCYANLKKVKYNPLTSITENMERSFKEKQL